MKSNKLIAECTRAMELRLDQKNDEAFRIYLALKSSLVDAGECLYFKLLTLSILRWRKKLAEAQIFWNELSGPVAVDDLLLFTYYHLEGGHLAFMHADHDQALHHYHMAYVNAPSVNLKVAALLNVIFVMDFLQIDRGSFYAELEKIVGDGQGVKQQGVLDQYYYLKMKTLFLEGKISDIQKMLSSLSPSQAQFFAYYLGNVPFLQLDCGGIVEAQLHKIYHGPYRLRTIKCLLNPDDFAHPNEFDDIYRIYLWFWYWLMGENQHSLSNLYLYAQKLKKHPSEMATTETRVIIRNLGLWVDLLHENKVGALRPNGERSTGALFELESLYIHYLMAKKSGDLMLAGQLLGQMNALPSFHDPHVLFKQWIETNAGPTGNSRSAGDTQAWFQVDEFKRTIVDIPHGKRKVSEAMVRALMALRQCDVMEADYFARQVYDLSSYDSFVHAPKIRNLLTQIKKMTRGVFQYSLKGELLYVQCDWRQFCFILEGQHSKQLKQFPVDEVLAIETHTHHPLVKLKDLGEKIGRKDLEAYLGISRSSAGRLLTGLAQKGLAEKMGSTRDALYMLRPGALEEIQVVRNH